MRHVQRCRLCLHTCLQSNGMSNLGGSWRDRGEPRRRHGSTPAGAGRLSHLSPRRGLAEIERKRIELRHEVIGLLSGQTTEDLEDPLRAEQLRQQLLLMVNEKVLKKSKVKEVFITGMHLQ
ncbi:MAG TPA: hypothetical protein DIC52_10640 [Candidatus Latescibacteria bacterium]|nr:hypothetical protein [Candidatus Latescibacterota bacterium]